MASNTAINSLNYQIESLIEDFDDKLDNNISVEDAALFMRHIMLLGKQLDEIQEKI